METVPGRVSRTSSVLLSTPVACGYKPLRNEAREGPQTGYWQKARLKVIASFASLERFGVVMGSYPEVESVRIQIVTDHEEDVFSLCLGGF